MKRVLRSLALVAIAVVSFTAAQAQNPHFKKGEGPIPEILESPVRLQISGDLYGCGNSKGVLLSLTSRWDITYDCIKTNGTRTPGIFSAINVDIEGTVTDVAERNGRLHFEGLTNHIQTFAEGQKYGWAKSGKFCPGLNSDNSPWDLDLKRYSLVSATLTANGVTVWTK